MALHIAREVWIITIVSFVLTTWTKLGTILSCNGTLLHRHDLTCEQIVNLDPVSQPTRPVSLRSHLWANLVLCCCSWYHLLALFERNFITFFLFWLIYFFIEWQSSFGEWLSRTTRLGQGGRKHYCQKKTSWRCLKVAWTCSESLQESDKVAMGPTADLAWMVLLCYVLHLVWNFCRCWVG